VSENIYTNKIVDLILKNRISTTEVADALGKSGSIDGVVPINYGHFIAGRVKSVFPASNSNANIHKRSSELNPGEILYIKPKRNSDIAYFGELVAKYAILYRQASGIVIEGKVRDLSRLRKENYPIWATGSNPVGATNEETSNEYEQNEDDQILVCDDGGVVLIEPPLINESLFKKLIMIEAVEDLWGYCLNTLKWNTMILWLRNVT
jgi:regulator of RNase E activity RraA